MSAFKYFSNNWLLIIVVVIVCFARLVVNQSPSREFKFLNRFGADAYQDVETEQDDSHHPLVQSWRYRARRLTPANNRANRLLHSVENVICPERAEERRYRNTKAKLVFFRPDTNQDIVMSQDGDGNWPMKGIQSFFDNGFKLDRPTIIYSHGFMQFHRSQWLMLVRRHFVKMHVSGKGEKHNVMFYDWGNYGLRSYETAAGYAPYLGRIVANFLEHLRDQYKYNLDKVQLVGYSLSTQIFGQTGRKLGKNQLGQLTLIDPTGVCFHSETEFAKNYSVKPDDAKLVVAAVYDFGNMGPHRAIGGVDIMVNGGSNQPRFAVVRGLVDHIRAVDHEVVAFDDDCHDVAYSCPSYEAFLQGECGDCGKDGSRCYMMKTTGAIKLKLKQTPAYPNNTMYITTEGVDFCIHHYQIVAKLQSNSTSDIQDAFESGALSLSFNNGAGRITPSHRVNERQYTALMRATQKLKSFQKELNVAVRASNVQLNDLISSLEYIDVKYMSNIYPEERTKASARYCPEGKSKIVKCSS